MAKRPLYLGPMKGFYTHSNFQDFVQKDLSQKLDEMGLPSRCNPEETNTVTTFHFPQAGIGLEYRIINPYRCVVQLLGNREDHMEAITLFIVQKDSDYTL